MLLQLLTNSLSKLNNIFNTIKINQKYNCHTKNSQCSETLCMDTQILKPLGHQNTYSFSDNSPRAKWRLQLQMHQTLPKLVAKRDSFSAVRGKILHVELHLRVHLCSNGTFYLKYLRHQISMYVQKNILYFELALYYPLCTLTPPPTSANQMKEKHSLASPPPCSVPSEANRQEAAPKPTVNVPNAGVRHKFNIAADN